VAGCGECGDEPSGSCATELVSFKKTTDFNFGLTGVTYVGYVPYGANQ
jgi:hypothetical protein